MGNSGLIYKYWSALLLAQEKGPVSLSGIANDLGENIRQAESDYLEPSPRLRELNKELRVALDDVAWDAPTKVRNRDPEVKRIVGKMADLCFVTEHMERVGMHPLVALPVAYMADLAGHLIRDPYHLTRWGEARDKAQFTHDKLVAGNVQA